MNDTRRPLGNVIITGGASGLGAATVAAVRAAGGTPWVVDRQQPGVDVEWERADLADSAAAEQATRTLAERAGGRIDGVFTAAGTDCCGPLEKVDTAAWEQVVRVNLLGTAAVIRAALPALRAAHGKVVTCASTLGVRALPDASAYCASKFGVVGFTRALAAETAGEVDVTMLVPGGMDTHFFDGRPEQYAPGPEVHLENPANVADAVVFALSRPPGSPVREMLVCADTEASWP